MCILISAYDRIFTFGNILMVVEFVISKGDENIAYKINNFFPHESVHAILSYFQV